jgi:integrase
MQQHTNSSGRQSIDGPRLAVFDPEAVSASSDSTPKPTPAKRRRGKPAADNGLPIWQRKDGRWCRKIKGRVHYFGTDKDKALEEWERTKADLLAGRKPRTKSDGLTVGDLCNAFLNAKRQRVESGELSPLTHSDYHQTCARLVSALGKDRPVDDLASDDFEALRASLSKTRGLVGIGNVVRLSRIVFKYAYDADLIERPVKFGPMFKVPSKKNIRKAKAGKPAKMFTAEEIRMQLAKADDVLKCMILLGINCGFGQTDVANLPNSAVDLKAGWITFDRVKTGAPRRIPLWPETKAAIREAIAKRHKPKNVADSDLVFISKYGNRVVRSTPGLGRRDGVADAFSRLLGILNQNRPGLGYYALRHTFATISGAACDQVATNAVMGHTPAGDDVPSMYRESIGDDRLLKVVNHVRAWLFPAKRRAK